MLDPRRFETFVCLDDTRDFCYRDDALGLFIREVVRDGELPLFFLFVDIYTFVDDLTNFGSFAAFLSLWF